MGHVTPTSSGKFRANWREPDGKQRAKTFKTRKEANAYLAEVESAKNAGRYVNPHAGRVLFGEHAAQWMRTRRTEITTAARDESVMRTHVLPQWASWPLGKIDELSIQAWVTELAGRRSQAVVSKALQLTSAVLRSAVRNQLIRINPCEGVTLPRARKRDSHDRIISRDELRSVLLPAVPDRYRAVVALAAGAGLRWGEVIGLRNDALDLADRKVHVIRTVVEVSGRSSIKPYPKSGAGRRSVPLPGWLVEIIRLHLNKYPAGAEGLRFVNQAGGPLLRGLFRTRVWRPSLVRSGLLGKVRQITESCWAAEWVDDSGRPHSAEFASEAAAVKAVARSAAEGLRFHDLRHSYATWLVDDGVPINMVQRVMGHERASTTLDLYTRRTDNSERILKALDDDDGPCQPVR